MRRKENLPELLAPAGDFECLVAAVRGGADAVYIGGKSFGARAYAKNFDIEEIARAAVYCHIHGVRLYVTVNTLLLGSEIESAVNFAINLYKAGVDALIVADLGLVRVLRRVLPDMELHASTQMSVHNSLGADVAYGEGLKRVVLARELSYEDIFKVTNRCEAEIEVFVHGALCVCHSGQCLFSSMIGGRSGNRGECAQPCRLPYNRGKAILSLSDLSLAGHIAKLIDSGVSSLKIEGRMKSPDYVYTVTSIYRKLLDEHRDSTQKEDKRLRDAFSRGGFTDGYFTGRVQEREMCGVRSEGDKEASRRMEGGDYTPDRVKLSAKAIIRGGERSMLSLRHPDGYVATVYGEVPEAARSVPLTEDSVRARFSKMGGTFFSLASEDIELYLDEGLNLSPAELNRQRREAVESLEGFYYTKRRLFECGEYKFDEKFAYSPSLGRTAYIRSPEVFMALKNAGRLSSIDAVFLPLDLYAEAEKKPNGVALPPVVFESEIEEVRAMLKDACNSGVKYALVGNLGHIPMVKECGLVPVGDFRLNTYNISTLLALSDLGISDTVLSVELSEGAVRSLGGRVLTFGRIPLMITERCFIKDEFGCTSCERAELTDRRGVAFPIRREYKHRNVIYNSTLTYMGDKLSSLSGGRTVREHLLFSTETEREALGLIDCYLEHRALPQGVPLRRMGRRTSGKGK